MRSIFFFVLFTCSATFSLHAQGAAPTEKQRNLLASLITDYAKARETKDTILLKRILTPDVDQLVSTGEWRSGLNEAVQGMLRSSAETPGTRTLVVERVRLLDPKTALVDCRYTIQNADGSVRKMWSTFVIVAEKNSWKIAAIRNMFPTQSS